jgi:hypothetical protein
VKSEIKNCIAGTLLLHYIVISLSSHTATKMVTKILAIPVIVCTITSWNWRIQSFQPALHDICCGSANSREFFKTEIMFAGHVLT